MREVLVLTYEFIITLVLLVGSGILLYYFKGTQSFEAILALVSAALSSALTFWFQRRQTEKMLNSPPIRGWRVDETPKDLGGGTNDKTN